MWAWHALVMLSLVNGWFCLICCCYGCLEEERFGLLEIKAWISHPNGDSPALRDWVDNKEGADCCEWSKVECDPTTRRVIRIDLSFARGYESLADLYLNASVFLPFKELQSLDLSGNQLIDSYKNKGFQVLASSLKKLEELDLSSNNFCGSFLSSLSGLSYLMSLDLSYNLLTGFTGADGWCGLKKLEYLDLTRNKLEGHLPPCLGNMTSLRSLNVSYNHLVGDIASSPIIYLTLLESLSVSNNHFRVPISFQSFMNFSYLKHLSCGDNKLMPERRTPRNLIPKFQLTFFSFSNAFSTEIPKFLYTQYDLRILDLSYNNLSGLFPSWIIQNNTRLENIYMGDNSFSGPLQLPSHSFPNIEKLDISNNKIYGQIPGNTCFIFPNLQELFMSNNELAGSIPNCVGNMSSLFFLDLSNNQLSSVGLLMQSSSLRVLRLSNNNLDGQISLSFFNSSELSALYLDGNKFEGQIWDFPIKFSFCEGLDISNNHLTGMLPKWLSNAPMLRAIDLSNNHFVGFIPRDFCKLDLLQFLDLSENHLSGMIPSCLNPPHLTHAHMHKNRLTGPLKHAFTNCSQLVTLDLRENNLTGSIPNMGHLSLLNVVLLGANNFEGQFPSQFCSLEQLSILDISQNKLSGHLPSCLGNLTFEATGQKALSLLLGYLFGMHTYSVVTADEVVEFTTKRHSYLYKGDILNFMSGVDLSCNKFTGEIPPELGNLSGLHALNLSFNNFTGFIPATFSNLKQIESLDLTNNNLIGGIPPQLDELYSLSTFNVSYNNLSGRTPERKNQFGTFDESSYLGNPLLCGPPLQNGCGKTESPSQPVPKVKTEEDDGFMDMDAFYVTFGVCYVIAVLTVATILYINPYWRRKWFYFIEDCMDPCYCFVLNGLHELSNFRRRQ